MCFSAIAAMAAIESRAQACSGVGNQSHVAFGKILSAQLGNGAQHRHAAMGFDASAQDVFMPGAGHPVQDNAL